MGAQLKRDVAVSRSPAHGDSSAVRSEKMASELQRGAGPNQSIRALYEAHADEISSFLKARFGAGPPDPQDIVQQTFVNYLGKGDGSAIRNPRAFLYRIAINLTIQQRRAAQRRRKLLPDYARTHGDPTDELHPERVLLAKEQVRALEDALNQLGERDRTLLLLHRLEGVSYAEIARRTGMAPSSVRYVIGQALKNCQQALQSSGLWDSREELEDAKPVRRQKKRG